MQRILRVLVSAAVWGSWGIVQPVFARDVEPIGPQGTLGPVGSIGPSHAPRSSANQAAVAPPRPAPAAPRGRSRGRATGNHIEATGNSATGRVCGGGQGVSVNSVDVRGARLEGRTVIVQGRNARDVDTRDCPPVPAQVNSIRIR